MNKKANQNGSGFESKIGMHLEKAKIGFLRNRRLNAFDQFGKQISPDFLVVGTTTFPSGLGLECRCQKGQGSADEKIAYMVEKCREYYPIPAIIVCSGAFSRRQLVYAKERIGGNLRFAFNLDEFADFCDEIGSELAKCKSEFNPKQITLF